MKRRVNRDKLELGAEGTRQRRRERSVNGEARGVRVVAANGCVGGGVRRSGGKLTCSCAVRGGGEGTRQSKGRVSQMSSKGTSCLKEQLV